MPSAISASTIKPSGYGRGSSGIWIQAIQFLINFIQPRAQQLNNSFFIGAPSSGSASPKGRNSQDVDLTLQLVARLE